MLKPIAFIKTFCDCLKPFYVYESINHFLCCVVKEFFFPKKFPLRFAVENPGRMKCYNITLSSFLLSLSNLNPLIVL